MSLTQYKQKRKFSETPEPSAKIKKIKSRKLIRRDPNLKEGRAVGNLGVLRFVVQEHHASHLHWDFRLEMDGVLKSWAVPKSPPTEKGIKRLAVQVEDHPLEYAKFSGEIPEGNYGAGKVEIWDKGTYELKFRDSKKIEVVLDGKKLKGNFVLVKTHFGNKPKKSWLLMKV